MHLYTYVNTYVYIWVLIYIYIYPYSYSICTYAYIIYIYICLFYENKTLRHTLITIYRINAAMPITLNNQSMNYQCNVSLKILLYTLCANLCLLMWCLLCRAFQLLPTRAAEKRHQVAWLLANHICVHMYIHIWICRLVFFRKCRQSTEG